MKYHRFNAEVRLPNGRIIVESYLVKALSTSGASAETVKSDLINKRNCKPENIINVEFVGEEEH